jgi:hypothetical protein
MRISFFKPLLLTISLISVFSFVGLIFNDVTYAEAEAPPERETREIESQGGDPAADSCSDDCGLVEKYATPFLNFLGAIVGLVVTISIVFGGIQYASSADDPNKVAAAKSRIVNAVIALVAFLFMYGFLQWIIPGGFI